jgi:hypothetical protein
MEKGKKKGAIKEPLKAILKVPTSKKKAIKKRLGALEREIDVEKRKKTTDKNRLKELGREHRALRSIHTHIDGFNIAFNERKLSAMNVMEHIIFLWKRRIISEKKARQLAIDFLRTHFSNALAEKAVKARLISEKHEAEIRAVLGKGPLQKKTPMPEFLKARTPKEEREYKRLVEFYKGLPEEIKRGMAVLEKLPKTGPDGRLLGIKEAARMAGVKLPRNLATLRRVENIYLSMVVKYYKKKGWFDARTKEGIEQQRRVLGEKGAEKSIFPVGALPKGRHRKRKPR